MRNIAISDIHGCAKTFRYLVEEQVKLKPDDTLYLLGDYVDRGPDSRGVIDYMNQLAEAGYRLRCLKGNHEEMMVDANQRPGDADMWLSNGGKETLLSFGVHDPSEVPSQYIEFIEGLDHYFEVDQYILVHAGLNFVGGEGQSEEQEHFIWKLHNPLGDLHSMMWIRWWYDNINWNWLRDRVIIHGHTPLHTDEITEMFYALAHDQVLDIDNGCFAKERGGMGQLCAFDMTHRQLFFQENID
jgi:serine/threonine protein phosphatase 1